MKKLLLILCLFLPSLFSAASASIVGSWYVFGIPLSDADAPPGWAGGPAVITFMDNGQYLFAQDGVPGFDEDGGMDGMEYGTYSYDGSTITITVELDTNGGWGFGEGPGTSPVEANLTGDVLSIPSDHPTQNPFSFARVTSTSIVGGWKVDGPVDDESIVMTFLDDGNYMMAHGNNFPDPNGQAGIEYGAYTWDSVTGAFSIIFPLTDTNGEFGLSHSEPTNVDVSLDGNSMSMVLNDNVISLSRIGTASVPAVLACDVRMNQATYIDGDTVTAAVFSIANLTGAPIAAEWKVWLGVPGVPPISIINLGSDGSFVLPAGTDVDLGPLPLLPVNAALPSGGYEFSCRLLDPVTGELLAEDRNFFEIQENNTYVIGDTGPAGGIVFYVTDGGVHGLEAAPVDQAVPFAPGAEWGCVGVLIPGADGTAIGTGAQNTADILAGCAEPGIAARLTDAYTLNGFSDWFLPSIDELNELYLNRVVVGGIASHGYWSSTEFNGNAAWLQDFFEGGQSNGTKSNAFSYFGVRAIRAF